MWRGRTRKCMDNRAAFQGRLVEMSFQKVPSTFAGFSNKVYINILHWSTSQLSKMALYHSGFQVIWWRLARDWKENFIAVSLKQAACSSKCAFAVSECWCTTELFCLASYYDWNSELCCKYEKCVFGQLGSVFQFNGESVLHLDGSDVSTWIAQHATPAAPYCKLENPLLFYFNLLFIVTE